jgi:two-component system sensor histidine kinase YesM
MVLIVIGVLLVSTFVLSKSLTKPLSDMSEQMKRVEKGDFDISLPVTSRDEIGTLAKNFNEMSRQLKI